LKREEKTKRINKRSMTNKDVNEEIKKRINLKAFGGRN